VSIGVRRWLKHLGSGLSMPDYRVVGPLLGCGSMETLAA
jgi:hypothetical protein